MHIDLDGAAAGADKRGFGPAQQVGRCCQIGVIERGSRVVGHDGPLAHDLSVNALAVLRRRRENSDRGVANDVEKGDVFRA
jgi:hypothetical protein